MSTAAPTSVWQGSFTLLGVELKCHVLSDGKRIIERDSLEALFYRMGDSDAPEMDHDELHRFFFWQRNGGSI